MKQDGADPVSLQEKVTVSDRTSRRQDRLSARLISPAITTG
jgi:hypothetical protein